MAQPCNWSRLRRTKANSKIMKLITQPAPQSTDTIKTLKSKRVTIELNEFDLLVLAALAETIGGGSDARRVFSHTCGGTTGILEIAQEHFNGGTSTRSLSDLLRIIDNSYDMVYSAGKRGCRGNVHINDKKYSAE